MKKADPPPPVPPAEPVLDEPPVHVVGGTDGGKTPHVTVGGFYRDHGEELGLRLVGPEVGFERRIGEPTINRPGLALSGFYEYFAHRRIQVIGSAELTYLKSLRPAEMASRFRQLCARKIPCVVFSRDHGIHEHRNLGLGDLLVEIRGGDGDGIVTGHKWVRN